MSSTISSSSSSSSSLPSDLVTMPAVILGELRAFMSRRDRTGLVVIEFRECGECERGLLECTGLMETPRVV